MGRLLAFSSFLTNHPHTWLFSHPWEMGLLANSLLHGQGYSSPFGGSTGPTAFIAPGYPTLVAGIFAVFGSFTLASAVVIVSLNILVSLATIWLMIGLAVEFLDTRTAAIAGLVWAMSLPLWWVPEIFWESSFSEFFLIAIVALALRYRRAPTPFHWIVLGVCCAIVSLINPALLFCMLAIMGWLAWHTWRASRTAPLLGLLALAVVFAPWPIRNAVRFHAFIPLRSTVGFELWMGNRPGSDGRLDESLFPMFDKHELANYLSQGEVAYTSGKSAQAWDYIHAHPATFADVTRRRVWRFWAGTGNAGASVTFEIYALFTSLFGFAGLVVLYRRRMRSFAVLLALPLLLFPLPYYITHAEFRYRLNIDPVLTVLAAYAVAQLAAAWSRRTAPAPAPQWIEAKQA